MSEGEGEDERERTLVCLGATTFFGLGLRCAGGSETLLAGQPEGTLTVEDL